MDDSSLIITTPAGSYPILVGAGLLETLPEQMGRARQAIGEQGGRIA